MREFFRGWRRKIGVCTLVMALALVGMWIRSFHLTDEVAYGNANQSTALITQRGAIALTRFENHDNPYVAPKWSYGTAPSHTNDSFNRTSVFIWRVQWCGFDFGKRRLKNYPTTTTAFWTIPFWFIVIALTVLSFRPLLSKPRKSNQKEIAESMLNESGAS